VAFDEISTETGRESRKKENSEDYFYGFLCIGDVYFDVLINLPIIVR
jgi:hypothetical protein